MHYTPRDINLIRTWRIYMERPPKTPSKNGHRFCGMEFQNKNTLQGPVAVCFTVNNCTFSDCSWNYVA
jgi:hypothetical protein